MKDNQYNLLILGGGLSGLQLAMAFAKDSFFDQYSIAIIETDKKNRHDRNWSFWEKGEGQWEEIIYKQWESAYFYGSTKCLHFDLSNYRYKTIRSIDFYTIAKQIIESSSNIEWIEDVIIEVDTDTKVCRGKNNTYTATKIFDGVSKSNWEQSKHPTVLQHFRGWNISTEKEVFSENSFCMMDFRLGFENQCSFTYILPFSSKKALVEYTFFSPEKVPSQVYDQMLKKYISDQLGIKNYSIDEKEEGVIPMSTYPFHKANQKDYIKIGTQGGWVKPSSGYSFKSTENKIKKVIQNLKSNQPLDKHLFKKRFQYYDRIFLRLLQEENQRGASLFEQLYSANSINDIFLFLDEETTLLQEMRIMNNFEKMPFLKSFGKELMN